MTLTIFTGMASHWPHPFSTGLISFLVVLCGGLKSSMIMNSMSDVSMSMNGICVACIFNSIVCIHSTSLQLYILCTISGRTLCNREKT